MLHGELASLRELRREDLPVLHTGADSDPELHASVMQRPWRPVTLARRQAEFDKQLSEPQSDSMVLFAIQRRDDAAGRCIGSALLWDIDTHQRTAHLGVGLTPQARGKGLGRDVVRVLCHYAFDVRSMYRVGLETLESNAPMRAAALACGFREEGRLREAAWVLGRRVDEVVYGLLEPEWRAMTAS